MPENKIAESVIDPFKPAQPRIPGVSASEENAPRENEKPLAHNGTGEVQVAAGFIAEASPEPDHILSRLKSLRLPLTLAAALSAVFLWVGLKQKAAPANAVEAAVPAKLTPSASNVPANDTTPESRLPTGPGPVATAAELSKTWSAARFYFRDPLTSKSIPAMVVRLPGGVFWGFSLQEPFGSCEFEYVTDLRKLRAAYAFDAVHPMVANPCNGTVFDLTHYGNAPSGLVRGEIEKGPGWRPPIAIEVRVQGNQVIAERMER